MKTIVIAPSPNPKILPPTSKASPSFEGRSEARDSARCWSFSPMSVRRSSCWKMSEARMRSTMFGRSSMRSRTAPTNGLISRYASPPRSATRESTTSIAAFPRFMAARSSSHVTGVCRTMARKNAMKTQKTACRAARNAHAATITARTVTTVRTEIVISTRFAGGSGVATEPSLGPEPEVGRPRRYAMGAPAREMRTSPLTVRMRSSTCGPSDTGGASPTSRSELTEPLTDWASIQSARPGRVATWTSPETRVDPRSRRERLQLDVAGDGAHAGRRRALADPDVARRRC